MVFKKILFIGLGVIGTSAAVAGISTGVVYATRDQVNSNQEENINPTEVEPGKIPTASNNQSTNNNIQADDASKEKDENEIDKKSKFSLEEVLKYFNDQSSYVIRGYKTEDNAKTELDNSSKLEAKDLYSFNLKDEQIQTVNGDKYTDEFDISIRIDDKKNTIQTYNNGELILKVSIKEKNQNNNGLPTDLNIKLDGFKKASDTSIIKQLFKNNQDSKYELSLISKDVKPSVFYSIEKLNEVKQKTLPKKANEQDKNVTTTGLSELLWNAKFDDIYLGDYLIEGQVKLQKIDKSDAVDFYLTSSNATTPLKVIKRDETATNSEEVLIGSIKLNNLLATKITISPTKSNNKIDEEFIKAIKSASDGNKGFLIQEDKHDINHKILLDLNPSSDQMPKNLLSLNPFSVEKSDIKDSSKIDIEVVVDFGKGSNLKRYKSSIKEQRTELEKAGFSFDIYSKTLDEKDAIVQANKLTDESHKLTTYFKDENYASFVVDKPTVTSEKLKEARQTNGNYHIDNIDSKKLSNLQLDVQKSKSEDDIKAIETELPTNVLVFSGYSYEIKDNTKISFTPSITLIHIKNEVK